MGRHDRIGVDEHSALSGGLGAGFTELGMAGMSGTALGVEALPVLAGGALGAIFGTETQVGVYNALDRAGANTDTKESLSDMAGGAWGCCFSATSIAGAVAMGSRNRSCWGIARCRRRCWNRCFVRSGCLGCFENVSSRNEKTRSPSSSSQLHATDAYR